MNDPEPGGDIAREQIEYSARSTPVKALLFDFDGVLIESEEAAYRAWCEIYAEHGQELDISDWVRSVGTLDGFDPIVHLRRLLGGDLENPDDVQRRRRVRKQELVESEGFRPGVERYLEDARRLGLKVAIVTSHSTEWIGSHLERLGRAEGWDCFRCADGDHTIAKPLPHLYESALEELALDAGEAIAFEDSPNGIKAAKAAGLYCVVTPNPITEGLDLSAGDLRLESLEEMTLEELLEARATGL